MTFLERCYNRFLENIILPLGDRVFGTSYVRKLKFLRATQAWTREELLAYQKQRLGAMLAHAVTNIEFYRALNLGRDSDPVKQLHKFPLLDKSEVRANVSKFLNPKAQDLEAEYSSGSTGVQGVVYLDREAQSSSRAALTLIWGWAGYHIGLPMLQLGMSKKRSLIKAVKDFFFRVNYQLAFDLSAQTIRKALDEVHGKKSIYFGGYAAGLFAYAKAATSLARKPKFKSIISWGDKLFPHYRALLQREFGCRVHNTYGATEGFVIAGECEAGGMHIVSPHVYIEVLDDSGNEVPPGSPGNIFVTTLDNFAMPLIRYRLGDIVRLADPATVCPCGRPYPMLLDIVGRDTDIVYTPSGRPLIVHYFTAIFEYYAQIRQFKVVQTERSGITILYIPGDQFTPSVLEELREAILVNIDYEEFVIKFEEVREILPSKSGKVQIVESRMNWSI